MEAITAGIAKEFTSITGSEIKWLARSPGRVNIIGEHVDYNDGFVLPAAIDKAIYVGVSRRTDDTVKLHSIEFDESYEITLKDIHPVKSWSTYILGVVDQLIKRGHSIGGFNLVIDGDVPIGAGLSSSAAVECATAFALNELFELGIDKMELVRIAQKAEHTFSGVLCGIMDMFASVFGKKGHAIKLDCRSLEYQYEPIALDGYKIVLFNTNVKHSLASSAYNERRLQCEQGVQWVNEQHAVNSLRDVNIEMLDKYVAGKDAVVYNRCKFVVEEIQRVLDSCAALEKGDIQTLGKKMFATHAGLSQMYEVSCKEADFLVDAVKDNPAVLGARMMGGGFGGCTINIVKEGAITALTATLAEQYKKATGLGLTTYISKIEDGTSLVKI